MLVVNERYAIRRARPSATVSDLPLLVHSRFRTQHALSKLSDMISCCLTPSSCTVVDHEAIVVDSLT